MSWAIIMVGAGSKAIAVRNVRGVMRSLQEWLASSELGSPNLRRQLRRLLAGVTPRPAPVRPRARHQSAEEGQSKGGADVIPLVRRPPGGQPTPRSESSTGSWSAATRSTQLQALVRRRHNALIDCAPRLPLEYTRHFVSVLSSCTVPDVVLSPGRSSGFLGSNAFSTR